MNTKNMWIAVISGAILTTLVSNLPILGLINCLLCAGFWGSAIFAVWLYRRLSLTLTQRQGLNIGLLTGLFAGIFGFLLGFVGLTGVDSMMRGAQQFMSPEDVQNFQAIPAWGGYLVNLVGVVFNIVFGALGGLLGGALLRTDKSTPA